MTENELKLLAGRLRLATQAKKPWHFFFFREGADRKPHMEVHRKEADAKAARKRGRTAAKKKEAFYGTVFVNGDGKLQFTGKSVLSEQQIRPLVKDNLAGEPKMAAMGPTLRGAVYEIEDLNPPPPIIERRPEIVVEPPEPGPVDPLEPLRVINRQLLAEARELQHTVYAERFALEAESDREPVLRALPERIARSRAFVAFVTSAIASVNTDLEDKVREFNARVAEGRRVRLDQLVLHDLDTAAATLRDALGAPPGLIVPRSFSKKAVGKALETAAKAVNADLLKTMDDRLKERTAFKGELVEILVTHCGSEWNRVKHRLLDAPDTRNPPLMWQMVLLRKAVVDQELLKQKKAIEGHLVVKSVGSQNLTSDYDLTLSTDNDSGLEIGAIRAFNAAIKEQFGKPPGVVFDTNLYAKDFLRVDDNIFEKGKTDGRGVREVEFVLQADRSDQDVAALTKMRQYMSPEEWNAYFDQMSEDGGLSEEKKKEIQLQLDETDALYLIKNRQLWDALLVEYERQVDDSERERDDTVEAAKLRIDRLAVKADEGGSSAIRGLQRALVDEIEAIGHHLEDLMLEVRNDLYLKRMETVRAVQAEGARIQKLLDDADYVWEPGEETPEARVDALNERARKLLGEANFFAAEAYLSEGPLQHIVFGSQSGKPEVFARLKPEHFLESINEQTGDFLKDVGHYGDNDGVAFYQTAKYLARMMDGIVKLATRRGFDDIEDELRTLSDWGTAKQVGDQIGVQLLPIRGAKGQWSSRSTDEKALAAVTRARAIFGYSASDATIANLKRDVLAISVELNQAVRKRLTMRPDITQTRRTFRHMPDV